MKIAYFDISSGVSGDMLLASLINAGLPLNTLKKELRKLKLGAYQLSINKVKHNGIAGLSLIVKDNKKNKYKFNDILSLINKSKLNNQVKHLSVAIFKCLAQAESKVHGISINNLHFHDVGATDAIIDIVGTCIAINKLGIHKIYASFFNTGIGSIDYMHGKLPIPAPATLEILKSYPINQSNIKSELTTPTGAAIITILAENYGVFPKMKPLKYGYGIGTYKIKQLSPLRVIIGECQIDSLKDMIIQIETNIDNMNPEFYEHIIDQLLKTGALDAFISSIRMKKNRLGTLLTVLCDEINKDKILNIIFKETTSLGVRLFLVSRDKLKRKNITIKTKYGSLRVKLSFLNNNITNISPEYETCRKIAKKFDIPIKSVYQTIKSTIRNQVQK